MENMATPMWDLLLPGLEAARSRKPGLDLEFFTFHRELEHLHEEAMEEALGLQSTDPDLQRRFRAGAEAALDLLAAFWDGIGDSGGSAVRPESRPRAAGAQARAGKRG